VATCPGSLIVHADGTIAGCTEDDEADGCAGGELRHQGDPVHCCVWTLYGCNVGAACKSPPTVTDDASRHLSGHSVVTDCRGQRATDKKGARMKTVVYLRKQLHRTTRGYAR
jgi:hypothetical protein